MKKSLLTLGTTIAVITPVTSVIACGETSVTKAGVEKSSVGKFNFDYSIDARTDIATTRSATQYEINVTGFDKKQIETLSSTELAIASFAFMDQIVEIVKENTDKAITGFTANGIRIDSEMQNEHREVYGKTFEEIVNTKARWYDENPGVMGIINLFSANGAGDKLAGEYNPATLTFTTVFWEEFKVALGVQNILAEGGITPLDDFGMAVSGTKLQINGDNFGFLENLPTEFSTIDEASFYIGMGSNLRYALDSIETSVLEGITTLEITVGGNKKDITISDTFGDITFAQIADYSSNVEYQNITDIDATDSDYDVFFKAYSKFELSDDEKSVADWRSTEDFHYDRKTELLLLKLLMQYYK